MSARLWLYRTLNEDEDGDPYDHGVARADTVEELRALLADHLHNALGLTFLSLRVRVYPVEDAPRGVLASPAPFQTLYFPKPRSETP